MKGSLGEERIIVEINIYTDSLFFLFIFFLLKKYTLNGALIKNTCYLPKVFTWLILFP